MDDNKQRENGRHKHDHYNLLQSQWMIPPHLMKDPHALTMKFMTILADRDTVIQERNLALFEKKAALAERDMAILQRDQAIFEWNSVMMEKDNALAALEYRGNSSVNSNSSPTYPLGSPVPRGTKHMHHQQHLRHHSPHVAISSNKRALIPSRKVGKRGRKVTILADRDTVIQERNLALSEKKAALAERDMAILQRDQAIFEWNSVMMEKDNALAALEYRGNSSVNSNSSPTYPLGSPVSRGTKHMHHQRHLRHHSPHVAISSNKRALIPSRKVGKRGCKDLNRCSDPWRRHNLSLNHVYFDELSMPAPICSCTGVLHQCYKWGKGGWQSACCTSTLSMYPLPTVPNKRHSRLGGRKMSGSAFNKLLSWLFAEGHDLSTPLDLKDHWSRHGTNRYITIK